MSAQSTNRTQSGANGHPRPRLGIFKFASCDGCQLSLLDAEDELLAVVDALEVAYFVEASRHAEPGPYDVALVEGSISTAEQVQQIKEVRRQSQFLVAIGACATAGGIQALRNWRDVNDFVRTVYAHPEFIDTLATSTPISEHVQVDFELRGCPINKQQLLQLVTALLLGRQPRLPTYSVCMECKRRGITCVMVAGGAACLGSVTQAGCGALCPAYNRGCYGCYGPMEAPNSLSLAQQFERMSLPAADIVRLFRNFNGNADPFRLASDKYEEVAS